MLVCCVQFDTVVCFHDFVTDTESESAGDMCSDRNTMDEGHGGISTENISVKPEVKEERDDVCEDVSTNKFSMQEETDMFKAVSKERFSIKAEVKEGTDSVKEIDNARYVCEHVSNQQCVVKSEVKAEIGGVCTCGDVSTERFAVKSEVKEETDNKGKHFLHTMLISHLHGWI